MLYWQPPLNFWRQRISQSLTHCEWWGTWMAKVHVISNLPPTTWWPIGKAFHQLIIPIATQRPDFLISLCKSNVRSHLQHWIQAWIQQYTRIRKPQWKHTRNSRVYYVTEEPDNTKNKNRQLFLLEWRRVRRDVDMFTILNGCDDATRSTLSYNDNTDLQERKMELAKPKEIDKLGDNFLSFK